MFWHTGIGLETDNSSARPVVLIDAWCCAIRICMCDEAQPVQMTSACSDSPCMSFAEFLLRKRSSKRMLKHGGGLLSE